ncbi:MAG: galactokinase [Clostridiales bacterium]|jgi:galactokinase|nr:galactokinase [Clostridiales bacterium]
MKTTELKTEFCRVYGGAPDDIRLFSAAGRVNLIGEHIDYCGGRVFPAALNLRTVVAARKRPGSKEIRLAATTLPDRVTLNIDTLDAYRGLKWGDYQAGVAYVMREAGFAVGGCELLYDTTVPFGSGLSSSASIEVATARMLCAFSGEAGGKTADLVELAVLSQRAENTYNNVACGIMDQFAASLGKKAHAILLDCKTLAYQYIPLDLGRYSLVIANCNKSRSLIESKYNERRAECEQALSLLQTRLPGITCLADVSPEDFEKNQAVLAGKVADRARHVVGECARVAESARLLQAGNIEAFGECLNQSHRSLKDLYEVTGVELDALAGAAQAFDGCIGSRMTGAGFGGCTVSLVESGRAAEFAKFVTDRYQKAVGYAPTFYQTSVEDGAKELYE